jgi:hypothetical protein
MKVDFEQVAALAVLSGGIAIANIEIHKGVDIRLNGYPLLLLFNVLIVSCSWSQKSNGDVYGGLEQGVVVVNQSKEVVLANQAFKNLIGNEDDHILEKKVF